MSATTISRATWTDDDGTGTTGTILNNARLQADVYDKIDALFAANVFFSKATSGADELVTAEHTSNTAGSGAGFFSSVAGASGGDAYHKFTIQGATAWNVGVDNSDADAFVVSASGTLGTSNVIRFNTTGHMCLPEFASDPTTSDLAANAAVAIYNKNNTLVFAYNNGGTMTYLKIALNGSATTFTHNTTPA